MVIKNMKKETIPVNKWSFGIFIIDHWLKVISILIVAGMIVCLLQIKTFQCGNTKIVKQPIETRRTK